MKWGGHYPTEETRHETRATERKSEKRAFYSFRFTPLSVAHCHVGEVERPFSFSCCQAAGRIMGYYRGYRRRRHCRSYHVSKRRHLTDIFGGIVHDIERAFLALPSFELEAIFMEYGAQYGKSAESYARRTYPQWKNGTTKLSGQTAERLLELLPPRLSPKVRYDLVAKLRQRYLKRVREYVSTPPDTWREHVVPAVDKVIAASGAFKFPDQLYEKATWLADGDTEAVHRILHSIEEEEARQRTAYLDAEFKRIEVFVGNVKNTQTASHTISIPQGEIHVTIQVQKPTLLQSMFGTRRMKMSGDNHELVPREELQKALVIQQSRGSLLNLTLDNLTDQQKIDLGRKIVEKQVELDVSQAEADQRFRNSTRDMAQSLQFIQGLERLTRSDYEYRTEIPTSSGNSNFTVKKNNNTVIIVVAVVIGVVVFLLLTR